MKAKTYQFIALGVIVSLAAAWLGNRYVWVFVPPGGNPLIVHDHAGILSRSQEEFIREYHKELLHDHDIDYRTVIHAADAAGNINKFAFDYFTEHGVGRLSQSGRGLLLVIDTGGNLVRLEVSQALEGVYTDRFVSYIQHRQMIPFFQSERVADGILSSTELIFARAQQAERGQAFMPPMDAKSAGAGAVNPAQIGAGPDESFRAGPDVGPAAKDPRTVLAAYQEAMDQRNGSPELSIYTRETRSFLRQWVMTPAQMDNAAKSLRECPEGTLKMAAGYAVLRYPVSSRKCPPYFFSTEEGEWRLDLTMMSKAIRFNHRNQWHFDGRYHQEGHPYAFAFSDWRFDQHGFPWMAGHPNMEPERQ